jgi:hypothetical protein
MRIENCIDVAILMRYKAGSEHNLKGESLGRELSVVAAAVESSPHVILTTPQIECSKLADGVLLAHRGIFNGHL